jgi:hypothetical protein
MESLKVVDDVIKEFLSFLLTIVQGFRTDRGLETSNGFSNRYSQSIFVTDIENDQHLLVGLLVISGTIMIVTHVEND